MIELLNYIDHVYLDRLFLLSNLTWRRAHVTASQKINLDFCSAFEIRLLVESSYNKTNDLF